MLPVAEEYKNQDAYRLWLTGVSLRSIGRAYGVDFTTIRRRLIRAYGENACNPVANSLSRSLLTDYPYDPSVFEWVLNNLKPDVTSENHRSNHSIQMLSKYTVVHDPEMMDILAVSYDSSDTDASAEPLRLPMLEAAYATIARVIFGIIYAATC